MTKPIGRLLMSSLVAGAFALSLSLPGVAAAQDRTQHLNNRQENQQDRIQQGIKSGQLTRGEARRTEAREGRLQANKLEDKAKGPLTHKERTQLNRQANRDSRAIYRAKHNGKVR
ncbi:MAG: hypothetical protein ACRD1I_02210 [Terriglobia bacterium]